MVSIAAEDDASSEVKAGSPTVTGFYSFLVIVAAGWLLIKLFQKI